jgi:hypothetical protein
MRANAKIHLSDALMREWLRLPDSLVITGVSFDGRTFTLAVYDKERRQRQELESLPVYSPVYESRPGQTYELLNLVRPPNV